MAQNNNQGNNQYPNGLNHFINDGFFNEEFDVVMAGLDNFSFENMLDVDMLASPMDAFQPNPGMPMPPQPPAVPAQLPAPVVPGQQLGLFPDNQVDEQFDMSFIDDFLNMEEQQANNQVHYPLAPLLGQQQQQQQQQQPQQQQQQQLNFNPGPQGQQQPQQRNLLNDIQHLLAQTYPGQMQQPGVAESIAAVLAQSIPNTPAGSAGASPFQPPSQPRTPLPRLPELNSPSQLPLPVPSPQPALFHQPAQVPPALQLPEPVLSPQRVQFPQPFQSPPPAQVNQQVQFPQPAPVNLPAQLNLPALLPQPAQVNLPAQLPQPVQLPQPEPVQPPQPAEVDQPAQPAQPAAAAIPNVALNDRIHHKRKRRDEAANDPSAYYSPPTGLGPWGPVINQRKNEMLFTYFQRTAELKSGAEFSKDQLVSFFLGQGHPNPRRNLTLWIQNNPAQSNSRYASGAQSGKCRYKDCPGNQHTILKGFFRVAFDEFSDKTSTELDPMHNAGYMHLHCFESIFDLGYLIHFGAARYGFKIQPDTRNFVYESRNPASITRDHGSMAIAYRNWVKTQKPRAEAIEKQNATVPIAHRYTGFTPDADAILPHAQRLGNELTEHHLSLEVKTRRETREKRGGIHIGLHKGDLEKYEELKRGKKQASREPSKESEGNAQAQQQQQEQPQGSRSAAPQNKRRKRGADETEDAAEQAAPKRSRRGHTAANNDVEMQDSDVEMQDSIVVGGSGSGNGNDDIDLFGEGSGNGNNDVDLFSDAYYALPENDIYGLEDGYIPPPPPALSFPQPQPQPQPSLSFPQLSFPQPSSSSSSSLPIDPQLLAQPHSSSPTSTSSPASGARTTRRQSREAGTSILTQLAAHQDSPARPFTRSSAHAIQATLGVQPPHVRDAVLQAAGDEWADLILPRSGRWHDDRLAERIGVLSRRQRRAVEAAVAREEGKGEVEGEGARKNHSL